MVHYSRGFSSAVSHIDGENLVISKEVFKKSDVSGLVRIEEDTADGIDIWDLFGLSIGWFKSLL